MSSHKRFDDDEDDFESSESEDEKKLAKYRKQQQREDSDSEIEVFGVGTDDDSEDEDQSDIALSDVEGQEDNDDLPDVLAWGQKKKNYYGTDYNVTGYKGFEGKDAHAAEIEEEEGKDLQSQLLQQLDDAFTLDDILKKSAKDKGEKQNEKQKEPDLSKLTTKQKLQQGSPEFFALVDDFKAQITVAKDYLKPILEKVEDGSLENCQAVEFVKTHYHLILNYCVNIYMYIILKLEKKLKNHPVIQRLYQHKQLLLEIEPVFEEIVKPQIELILSEIGDKKESKTLPEPKKKKTLQLLEKLQSTEKKNIKKTKTEPLSGQPSKKMKFDDGQKNNKKVTFETDSSEDDSGMEVDNEKVEDTEENVDKPQEIGKRAITYQIAKNKGLTPHRKKELRNPRVKHKIKFRKALIRRKGAVREPRKELSRYSGEISGIKATVSKSIKIKS